MPFDILDLLGMLIWILNLHGMLVWIVSLTATVFVFTSLLVYGVKRVWSAPDQSGGPERLDHKIQ